jgi:hypothetical protein
LATFALILLAPEAFAQFGLPDAVKGTGIPNNADLAKTIGRILRVATGLVGTIFLVLMIYAGFLWMTARGDSKKVEQAKQLIMGAIIGTIIVASAYAITSFVLNAASGNAPAGDIPNQTVNEGGACGMTEDCVSPLICNGGVCKTENFGSCVNGKACTIDSDCGGSNGGCFDNVCSCDAI